MPQSCLGTAVYSTARKESEAYGLLWPPTVEIIFCSDASKTAICEIVATTNRDRQLRCKSRYVLTSDGPSILVITRREDRRFLYRRCTSDSNVPPRVHVKAVKPMKQPRIDLYSRTHSKTYVSGKVSRSTPLRNSFPQDLMFCWHTQVDNYCWQTWRFIIINSNRIFHTIACITSRR